MKASNLSVSKVTQFLDSKLSCTKITLATFEFKKKKSFPRFEHEIWCVDLAYIDKLANDNNNVKYLLVVHDLFDGTVDAKEWKHRAPKKRSAFLNMITKKSRYMNIWVMKRTKSAAEFKKLCKAEILQLYLGMSENRAAIADCTLPCLKSIFYRYMEDNGLKYFHKLIQFATTLNSRRTCSIDLIPKKEKVFCQILCNKTLRKFRKPKFKIGDKFHICE